MAKANLKGTIDKYAKFYPEYTKASVGKVIRRLKKEGIRLSAITVDHYCKPKRFGGKGLCRLKKRR